MDFSLALLVLAGLSRSTGTQDPARAAGVSPELAQEGPAYVEELRQLPLEQLIQRLQPPDPGTRRADAWVEGELARRLHEGTELGDDLWRAALSRSWALHTRDRWPSSEPLAVSMEFPGWLDPGMIRAVPRVDEFPEVRVHRSGPIVCGTCASTSTMGARYQILGSLPPGKHTIEFDVSVSREVREGLLRSRPVWSGTMRLEVEVIESLDELLPPVHGPGLEEGIRDGVRAWVSEPDGSELEEDEPRFASLGVHCTEIDLERYPALRSTAVALEVLLLRDGVAQQAGCISLSPAVYPTFVGVPVEAGFEQDAAERKRWSIRIRGVGQDVLANWHARARWDGSFEIRLDEALERTSKERR